MRDSRTGGTVPPQVGVIVPVVEGIAPDFPFGINFRGIGHSGLPR